MALFCAIDFHYFLLSQPLFTPYIDAAIAPLRRRLLSSMLYCHAASCFLAFSTCFSRFRLFSPLLPCFTRSTALHFSHASSRFSLLFFFFSRQLLIFFFFLLHSSISAAISGCIDEHIFHQLRHMRHFMLSAFFGFLRLRRAFDI
jgi:hypothetical protein